MTTQVSTPSEVREDALNRLFHGRLVVTGKSKKTGKHITLRFRARPDRGSRKRNVFLDDAKIVFVDAGKVMRRAEQGEGGEWYEYIGGDKVGYIFADLLRNGLRAHHILGVTPNHNADHARVWFADQVLLWLTGRGHHPQLEINLEDFCGHCGRELTHPESKKRGLGPVCFGKKAEGNHQKKGELV